MYFSDMFTCSHSHTNNTHHVPRLQNDIITIYDLFKLSYANKYYVFCHSRHLYDMQGHTPRPFPSPYTEGSSSEWPGAGRVCGRGVELCGRGVGGVLTFWVWVPTVGLPAPHFWNFDRFQFSIYHLPHFLEWFPYITKKLINESRDPTICFTCLINGCKWVKKSLS